VKQLNFKLSIRERRVQYTQYTLKSDEWSIIKIVHGLSAIKNIIGFSHHVVYTARTYTHTRVWYEAKSTNTEMISHAGAICHLFRVTGLLTLCDTDAKRFMLAHGHKYIGRTFHEPGRMKISSAFQISFETHPFHVHTRTHYYRDSRQTNLRIARGTSWILTPSHTLCPRRINEVVCNFQHINRKVLVQNRLTVITCLTDQGLNCFLSRGSRLGASFYLVFSVVFNLNSILIM